MYIIVIKKKLIAFIRLIKIKLKRNKFIKYKFIAELKLKWIENKRRRIKFLNIRNLIKIIIKNLRYKNNLEGFNYFN